MILQQSRSSSLTFLWVMVYTYATFSEGDLYYLFILFMIVDIEIKNI